ncbi:glutaminase A [Oscillibacter sp.]|uniref:glutaminase A n=1 Tax=Oscillibacter sp. TaxID=1945593 RepID=UPI0028A82FAA|nr:glutaminase A [Oscillibacter sp.]
MARNELIEKTLIDATDYARTFLHTGKVATYIPELAKEHPDKLGACVITTDGEVYSAGDWHQEFTIQSISKTLTLIMALQTAGYDKVFSKGGVEPTGDAFNSLVRLETKTAHPLNPMINAGAIATADCCMDSKDPSGDFLALTQRLCRRDTIHLDKAVFQSEKKAGMRNRSMAYLMQGDNILEHDAEDVVDLYFWMCSLSVNVEDLANYALILANNGVDPRTGETLLEDWIVRIVKTLMVTCGMYDASGEFAMKVGIPAKSGVGGGIMGTVERKMGLAAFNPALDPKGNSVGAYRVLEYLSHYLGLHYFSSSGYTV